MKKAVKGAERESRWSRMSDEGQEAPIPPNPYPQLTAILMQAGPFTHTGAGAAPLSALELQAWQHGTLTELSPWEFAVTLGLSSDYLAELQRAADPECPAPWTDLVAAKKPDVSGRIRSLLRS